LCFVSPPRLTKGRGYGYILPVKSFEGVARSARSIAQSPRGRRWLQLGVVAVVLLFFGVALWKLLPDVLAYRDWTLDPTYLALACVIMVARGPVGAYGWWLTLRRLGYRLPFWRSVRVVNFSNMAGYVPGSMWHAVSRVYLAEREGVPRLVSAISVGIEAVMVLLGSLLVGSLSLIGWKDAPIWAGLALLLAILAVMSRPQVLFAALNWLLVRLKRKPLEVSLTARDMFSLLPSFVLNWLMYGVLSWMLVAALDPTLPLAQMPLIAGIFTISWQVGYLTPVPQGVGVREGVIVGLLNGLAGVPVPVAAVSALLARALSILGVAVWAAIGTRL
jgi:glycosyltransferase 2 family protein